MPTNAILEPLDGTMINHDDRFWRAVLARDADHDGRFVFAVSSTGVYCRPSCPAKHPRRQNVTFYERPEQAEHAGYRACLRCRPKSADRNSQSQLVKAVCRYIAEHLDEPVTLARLGEVLQHS